VYLCTDAQLARVLQKRRHMRLSLVPLDFARARRGHALALLAYALLGGGAAVVSVLPPVVRCALGGSAALLFYFQCFALAHDAMHASLGLSRRVNRWVLTLSAACMLLPGHGMRVLHFQHHASPLGEGDVDGEMARYGYLGALLRAPLFGARYPIRAYRAVAPALRARVGLEFACVAAVVLVGSATAYGRAYLLLCVVQLAFMGVWAAKIPHHPPSWLLAVGMKLAWLRSPVIASLLYHDLHHQKPHVPCALLAGKADAAAPARG
jgi:fatty acid desaturase